MRKILLFYALSFLMSLTLWQGCRTAREGTLVRVYPDSVLSDVSRHPIGINVDYFMDDDGHLKPARSTADALKAMGVKYLRYPGGNKSDAYLFAYPPYEKAQPHLARTGKGAIGYRRVIRDYREYRYDVLDFDEFIRLCREVDAIPVVTVAADEYLVDYPEGTTWSTREELIRNAVEWVRYANVKKGYGVKYWLIGNECWHKNNKNSSAAIYARDVVDFSRAMKEVDPSIAAIPNGNSVGFCDTVLSVAGDDIDAFCISNYPVYGYRAGYGSYRDTLRNLMGPVDRAMTALEKNGRAGDLKLIIAEYGPFDWAYDWPMVNDMGHALCNFEMCGEQLLRSGIEFSMYWNTRWIDNDSVENSVFDALDRNGDFNATGYTLMIWGKYLGKRMVKTTSTLHLRTFASLDPGAGTLFVYLMNMLEEPQRAILETDGFRIGSVLQAWQLKGDGPQDRDPVWKAYRGMGKNGELLLDGTSITVIECQLEKTPARP